MSRRCSPSLTTRPGAMNWFDVSASTTKLADGRADLPTGEPGLFGFNAWNAN